MVHGAVHYFLRGILAIALLLLLLGIALMVRLSQGPLSLDFLNDTIEDMLDDPERGITVQLDQTVLTFVPEGRLVDIRLKGLRFYSGGESTLAVVPEASVSISGRALLHGQILPDSIEFYRPHLSLVRDEFGQFQWNIDEDKQTDPAKPKANILPSVLDFIAGEPSFDAPFRALQRFEITGATLDMEDLGSAMMLKAHDVHLLLERDEAGVLIEQSLALNIDGENSTLNSSFTWKRNNGSLSGIVRLNHLRPAWFADWGDIGKTLAMADFPLFGDLKVEGSLKLTPVEGNRPQVIPSLDTIALNLGGGAGILNLPDLKWQQAIKSLVVRAEAKDNAQQLDVNEVRLVFATGAEVMLAAHLTDIDPLAGRINSPAKLEAALYSVGLSDLPFLWPAGVADNARDWIVANLSDGVVEEVTANAAFTFPDGNPDNLHVESINGTLKGQGITVNYLDPMPKVVNASTTGTFDASTLTLNLTGGEVFALRIDEGTVTLSGLDQVDQAADIDLNIAGPATDVMVLIDHKPLGYARALGLRPETVKGDSLVHLHMAFPLLKDLKLDDLKVDVTARVNDLSIPKILMGLDLTDGQLGLTLDTKGLDAKGSIKLGGIDGNLVWRENFSLKNAAFASRYEVQVPNLSNEQRALLGLTTIPFIPPWLDGPIGGTVIATSKAGGKTEIKANMDLSRAAMRMVGLGWRKAVGQDARAEVLLNLHNGVLASLPEFKLSGPDLRLDGNGSFSETGALRQINLTTLRYGKNNNGQAALVFDGRGGITVDIRAAGLDVGPILSGDVEDRGKQPDPNQPPVQVALNVNRLWLSDTAEQSLSKVKGEITLAAGQVNKARIDGNLGQNGRLQVDIRPDGPQRRKLVVVADDAGALLAIFNITDSVRKGVLDLYGYYDDRQPGSPLTGESRIRDFYLVDAPALAKVLTVAALTGIGDALRGEGMHFEELSSNFVFANGLIKIPDMRAHGSSLGLTAAGEINLNNDTLALQGVVIPAYSINKVLGDIPLIGWLLTAGDSGGGLLAVNYSVSGPAKDPDVMVNPLSALTPGFLRHVFNIFDGNEPPKTETTPAPAAPPAASAPPAQKAPMQKVPAQKTPVEKAPAP